MPVPAFACLTLACLLSACSAGPGASLPSDQGGAGGTDPMGGSGGSSQQAGGGGPVGGGPSGGGTATTGGTGAGGSPGGAGGASTTTGGTTGNNPGVPFAGYDPNVRFVWEETSPQLGTCKPGDYEGTFEGRYSSGSFFGIPLMETSVSGTISLRLEAAASGEFLEIRDGRLEGVADTGLGDVPFGADLVGELDCSASRLVDSFLRNGSYTVPLGSPTFFEGPFLADYDRLAHQFVNGTWEVSEATPENPNNAYGGNGSWGAQWVRD
jgi:hypothetical protein